MIRRLERRFNQRDSSKTEFKSRRKKKGFDNLITSKNEVLKRRLSSINKLMFKSEGILIMIVSLELMVGLTPTLLKKRED